MLRLLRMFISPGSTADVCWQSFALAEGGGGEPLRYLVCRGMLVALVLAHSVRVCLGLVHGLGLTVLSFLSTTQAR